MDKIEYIIRGLSAVWIIFMLSVAILSLAQSSDRSNKYDNKSLYLLMLSTCTFIPALHFLMTEESASIGAYSIGYPYVSYLGIALIVGSFFLHVCSMFLLNKYWSASVDIQEDHQLVTSGIYGYVRHPIYACMFLEFLGFSLAISNWLAFILILLPNACALMYRVMVEERVLISFFGDDYKEYMKSTKRLIPYII